MSWNDGEGNLLDFYGFLMISWGIRRNMPQPLHVLCKNQALYWFGRKIHKQTEKNTICQSTRSCQTPPKFQKNSVPNRPNLFAKNFGKAQWEKVVNSHGRGLTVSRPANHLEYMLKEIETWSLERRFAAAVYILYIKKLAMPRIRSGMLGWTWPRLVQAFLPFFNPILPPQHTAPRKRSKWVLSKRRFLYSNTTIQLVELDHLPKDLD